MCILDTNVRDNHGWARAKLPAMYKILPSLADPALPRIEKGLCRSPDSMLSGMNRLAD
jgi:hypothetical protein